MPTFASELAHPSPNPPPAPPAKVSLVASNATLLLIPVADRTTTRVPLPSDNADGVAEVPPAAASPAVSARPAPRPDVTPAAAEPMNFFERHSTRLAGHYLVWGYCLLLLLDLAWMAYRVWRRVQQIRHPPIKT
jgi:hypothetical protein